MIVLRAVGLAHRYGARTVLDGLSLEVGPGEIVGLFGPNGAGKSTAFGILSGEVRAQAGQVFLGQTDVSRWDLARRVRQGLGYLPQSPSLFPRLTVRDNLALALQAAGRGLADGEDMLRDADLSGVAGQLAGLLSGGERRRLELARALALRPRVVLLDEPFAAVDPGHTRDLSERIVQLAERGIGVLLTDHRVRESLALVHRAYLLDEGVVQVSGTPEYIAGHPRARERYLGHDFCL